MRDMYKYGKVIAVRKVRWDMLWHVVYLFGKRETYDRVSKDEALQVAEAISC
jgi:hypothetical protein